MFRITGIGPQGDAQSYSADSATEALNLFGFLRRDGVRDVKIFGPNGAEWSPSRLTQAAKAER